MVQVAAARHLRSRPHRLMFLSDCNVYATIIGKLAEDRVCDVKPLPGHLDQSARAPPERSPLRGDARDRQGWVVPVAQDHGGRHDARLLTESDTAGGVYFDGQVRPRGEPVDAVFHSRATIIDVQRVCLNMQSRSPVLQVVVKDGTAWFLRVSRVHSIRDESTTESG